MLNSSSIPAGAELDPGVRDFIRITGEAYLTHGSGLERTTINARQIAEKVRAPWITGGPVMHAVTEHTVSTPHGGVRIRVYDPDGAGAKPALIYIHGGGWVMFSLDTHDRIMREYASRAGVCVVGVDYALSPEARFPVALEQIMAVVQHLRTHAADLNINSERLAIGGDSAGANLSLSTAIALRDAGQGSVLSGLILNYGAFGIDLSADDVRRYGGPDYMLTADEMAYFWSQYLARPEDQSDPRAVPLLADLHDLPPVFLCVPQCDVLTGQSMALDARLHAAGVETRAIVYAGASHSFLEAVSISRIAETAFNDAASWMRDRLSAR
ncbi:alpha/beta hydrolase fold domain-containing protein [Asticcacaulis sp. 201]|uniref:alpha/beta hydrolase fold domain-containing protein n=1 Tax=Asticcacaulis sp. 201 TaxID=3028787 RepID=UPI0029162E61|nr:alpha/beta hydrolase fold domain-containing protein [Asticcacaulis sp. 201]MDV6330740.1 alpha/beta hydrolase fold domain-containing protein [Asticcacaulis sp. 201]